MFFFRGRVTQQFLKLFVEMATSVGLTSHCHYIFRILTKTLCLQLFKSAVSIYQNTFWFYSYFSDMIQNHLNLIFWVIGQNYQKWLHSGRLRPYKHKNKLFHFRPAWNYEKARNTLTQTRNLQEKMLLYRRTLLLTYFKVLVIFLFTVSSFLRDLEQTREQNLWPE